MVSFRLSQPEYAAASLSCSQHGVRSVSSLARDAVLRLTNNTRHGLPSTEAEVLIHLQHQVLTLCAEIEKLKAAIQPAERPLTREKSAGSA